MCSGGLGPSEAFGEKNATVTDRPLQILFERLAPSNSLLPCASAGGKFDCLHDIHRPHHFC